MLPDKIQTRIVRCHVHIFALMAIGRCSTVWVPGRSVIVADPKPWNNISAMGLMLMACRGRLTTDGVEAVVVVQVSVDTTGICEVLTGAGERILSPEQV